MEIDDENVKEEVVVKEEIQDGEESAPVLDSQVSLTENSSVSKEHQEETRYSETERGSLGLSTVRESSITNEGGESNLTVNIDSEQVIGEKEDGNEEEEGEGGVEEEEHEEQYYDDEGVEHEEGEDDYQDNEGEMSESENGEEEEDAVDDRGNVNDVVEAKGKESDGRSVGGERALPDYSELTTPYVSPGSSPTPTALLDHDTSLMSRGRTDALSQYSEETDMRYYSRPSVSKHIQFEPSGFGWLSGIPVPADMSVYENKPEMYRKLDNIGLHQWIYHPAAPVLRNPFSVNGVPCRKTKRSLRPATTLPPLTCHYSGPSRSQGAQNRRRVRSEYMEKSKEAVYNPNPTATVPMRPRKWKKMTWLGEPEAVQKWKVEMEAQKKAKDHKMAVKLGYETLVGNLVYFDIPGARDLNRSWKHFLARDEMMWGFPYTKDSKEKPSLPLPKPYLVHQLKENMWRYPRNKLIIPSSAPEENNTGNQQPNSQ